MLPKTDYKLLLTTILWVFGEVIHCWVLWVSSLSCLTEDLRYGSDFILSIYWNLKNLLLKSKALLHRSQYWSLMKLLVKSKPSYRQILVDFGEIVHCRVLCISSLQGVRRRLSWKRLYSYYHCFLCPWVHFLSLGEKMDFTLLDLLLIINIDWNSKVWYTQFFFFYILCFFIRLSLYLLDY